jgi:hypothetical protein
LLDSESGYRLTSKCIVAAKRALLQVLNPELGFKRQSKKRKRAEFEADQPDQIIEYFEHEEELETYYSREEQRRIHLDQLPELAGQTLYAILDVKEVTSMLDLKKEVVLTMLN